MKTIKSKSAFTMVELIFVIVIIGILASVAIPRLAATRDDAEISKARVLISSIQNAVNMERQKRILRGDFNPIFRLTDSNADGVRIFNGFDGDTNQRILENPPFSCDTATDKDCWRETATGTLATPNASRYTYNLPTGGSEVFQLNNNRFECVNQNSDNCKLLTQ
jgi:general secretion pathway protein G